MDAMGKTKHTQVKSNLWCWAAPGVMLIGETRLIADGGSADGVSNAEASQNAGCQTTGYESRQHD
jgi:hypothetical protein